MVIAGRIALDRANEALFADVLPARIVVRASSPRAAGLRALVEQLLAEQLSAAPGARVASEKIAELLFVLTEQRLGWHPKETALLTDIDRRDYYPA